MGIKAIVNLLEEAASKLLTLQFYRMQTWFLYFLSKPQEYFQAGDSSKPLQAVLSCEKVQVNKHPSLCNLQAHV